MALKIDILTNDGSPLGVTLDDVHGKNGRVGVGGAELAMLTLCEAWAKRGDEITLYNDPKHGNDVFPQRPISTFDRAANRDALVIFRSPNDKSFAARGKKVWFSTDQYTVGSFKDFAPTVDEIVTISQFHADYFKAKYDIDNTHVIDLPVRTWEYEQYIERVPNQLIFCSVPDRGLSILHRVWDRIKAAVPEASLVITSDYRLWGADYMGTEAHMMNFARKKDVRFLGAIRRDELVKYQLQSDIHAYTNIYDELFCISCAECQVAGAYPITSDVGALATTNKGTLVRGNPNSGEWMDNFISAVVYYLQHRGELELLRFKVQEGAKKRFSLETILPKWDAVFNG